MDAQVIDRDIALTHAADVDEAGVGRLGHADRDVGQVVGTENDPNCPLPGANIAYASAMQAYASKSATNKISRDIAPKLFHTSTPEHFKMTLDWFSKWL